MPWLCSYLIFKCGWFESDQALHIGKEETSEILPLDMTLLSFFKHHVTRFILWQKNAQQQKRSLNHLSYPSFVWCKRFFLNSLNINGADLLLSIKNTILSAAIFNACREDFCQNLRTERTIAGVLTYLHKERSINVPCSFRLYSL